MKKLKWWFFIVAPPAFALFIALGGLIVKLLWNWLLPPLFGWPALTFWQALGMLALCRILFGGFGFHGDHSGHRCRKDGRSDPMTPEERDRFRQGMRDRLGLDPGSGQQEGA